MSRTRSVVVSVTNADILIGEENNVYRNPVSIALTRALGAERAIATGHNFAWPEKGPRITLPDEVGKFIERFDANMKVGELQFTVTVME